MPLNHRSRTKLLKQREQKRQRERLKLEPVQPLGLQHHHSKVLQLEREQVCHSKELEQVRVLECHSMVLEQEQEQERVCRSMVLLGQVLVCYSTLLEQEPGSSCWRDGLSTDGL